jgi:hypothetical protein
MRKISKEKQKQLALVVIATFAVLGIIGYVFIKGGYAKLQTLEQKKIAAGEKLDQMQKAAKRSKEVEKTYSETRDSLAEKEADMASGDLYSWMFTTLRRFQKGYKVELPQISPVVSGEVNLLPKFPYQQAMVTVGGSAHFHELGRFIADFENAFPYMRISNLSLDVNPGSAPTDFEKLSFKMEIVTLVKPG